MRLMRWMCALSIMAFSFPIFAAAGAARAKVNIPFEFEVSGKTLPAGTYILETVGKNGVMQIRSSNGHEAYFLISDTNVARDGSVPQIVFMREQGRARLKDLTVSRTNVLGVPAR